MSKKLKTPPKKKDLIKSISESDFTKEYFGNFPFGHCTCGRLGILLNIQKENWYCCHVCKTKRLVGNNMLSGWKYENKYIWEQNDKQIRDYEVIEGFEYLGRLLFNMREMKIIENPYEKGYNKSVDPSQEFPF